MRAAHALLGVGGDADGVCVLLLRSGDLSQDPSPEEVMEGQTTPPGRRGGKLESGKQTSCAAIAVASERRLNETIQASSHRVIEPEANLAEGLGTAQEKPIWKQQNNNKQKEHNSK